MPSETFLPKIIGHRGAKGIAPENTLISFKKASELGAKWIELDVKETADAQLIAIHDELLDRTTNGRGKVAQKNWNEIQTLDSGSWFSKEFAGEKVASLEECFKLFEKINLGANIEIKPCPSKEISTAQFVAKIIKNKWPKNLPSPLVSSFSITSLLAAKKENPELIIGVLFESNLPKNWKEIAKETKAYSININNDTLNKEMINEIISEGYKVLVYTVNNKERANELFQWGVTSVFTDYPYTME